MGFGAEKDDFVVKIRAISWMEGGENCGDARSTSNKANPRIKSNKILTHQQITKKKLGLFLVGIFEIGEEHNKIRLENKGEAPKS